MCIRLHSACLWRCFAYVFLRAFIVTAVGPAFADVPQAVLEAEQSRIETIAKVSKSTVAVFGPGDSAGGGSAVVISPDGYALTNFHVAKPVGNHLKCGMNDGEFYDAVIVGRRSDRRCRSDQVARTRRFSNC